MNIAELAIRRGTLTWTLCVAVLIFGWLSFGNLQRLEEPAPTAREALVVTPYPGASAQEAEREVSVRIEQSVRHLDQALRVESYSSRGLSLVRVRVHDHLDRQGLAQAWEALRREIAAVFHDWCSFATDPLAKRYYDWLLEEAARRARPT